MRRRTVISSAVLALAVPPGTAYASGSPGRVAASASEIGPLLFDTTILGGAFGRGPGGEQWVYTVASGEVGVFFALDAVSGEQMARFELPAAGGSWGLTVAPDSTVYVGTWPNAHLYRYVPGADRIQDLGQPPGFTGEPFAIWRVTTDAGGNVYGGTSGNQPGDGRVFGYDPTTGEVTDYGVGYPGDGIVRSVAYGHERVYAGTGPSLHLVEVDPRTGLNREIPLPDGARDRQPPDQYIYDVQVYGDYLLARAEPSKTLYVYDLAAGVWVDEQAGVRGFDFAAAGSNGGVWMVKDGELHHYDPTTAGSTGTGLEVPETRGLGWVRVPNKGFPRLSLAALTGDGDAWIYNPQTGRSRWHSPDIDPQPVTLRSIGRGPDGRIYASSYLSGGLAGFDPATGQTWQYPSGVGQAGTIATAGDRLYLGIYPSARLLSFDPREPFNYGANPIEHFSLFEHRQDRVFAIEPAGDRVALGTVAAAGASEGTLTFFNPETDEHEVHPSPVPGTNLASLAYDPAAGVLYGGAGSYLFAWDAAAGEAGWTGDLGRGVVSALQLAPDGHIWALTSTGWLLEIDTANPAQGPLRAAELYPGLQWDLDVDALLRHSRLLLDADGYLYGTTLGQLFRIDPATLDPANPQPETLVSDAYLLAADDAGDLYFARGTRLFTYARPAGTGLPS